MMSDSAEQMKMAAFLARSGESDRARSVFARLVEDDPANFQAWLWLSELCYNLEEQTALLDQAMKYLPAGADGRKDLQVHLNELRSYLPLPAASEIPSPNDADLRRAASPVDAPQIGELEMGALIPGADDDGMYQRRLTLLEAPSHPVDGPEKQKQGRPILDLARSLFTRLF